MAILTTLEGVQRPSVSPALPAASTSSGLTLAASIDLQTGAEAAFALVCEIEKWPVWLSFLRSARLGDADPLGAGSEVVIRSSIPGEAEECYEVDDFINNYRLSLVGMYSVRRRLEFRVERKTARSKLTVRLDYPVYGGRLAAVVDRLTARRKLEAALAESLVHFKGLVEYTRGADDLLADF